MLQNYRILGVCLKFVAAFSTTKTRKVESTKTEQGNKWTGEKISGACRPFLALPLSFSFRVFPVFPK